MRTTNVDKYQDIIDSRDVIERIEELEAERAEHEAATGPFRPTDLGDGTTAAERAADFDAWKTEEGVELDTLRALAAEAGGYAADWRYGEVLIRDSYFQEYARKLAEDCGAIDFNAHWPMQCIDWDQAARELQMDYTSIDFDGVTYWIR